MKKLLPLLMLIAVSLIACGGSGSAVDDTEWILQTYGGQNSLKTVFEDTEITTKFHSDEGRISGTAGCNEYSGRYEADGTNLTISEMVNTEKACFSPRDIMVQEAEFLAILANTQSFQADDTTLTIVCFGGQVLNYIIADR